MAITSVRSKQSALSNWQTWTPSFESGWSMGNATHVSAYRIDDKICTLYTVITLGTTTTVALYPNLYLPVAMKNRETANFNLRFEDAGVAIFHGVVYSWWPENVIRLNGLTVTSGAVREQAVSTTTPFTWTSGDRIWLAGVYEVA